MHQDLVQKLRDREATVGIIGLGYVGLPLARAFAQAGHRVLGFDVDPAKVEKIERGESYIDAVPTPVLAQLRRDDLVRATTDFSRVAEVRAIAICVPTPLTVNQDPDTSFIEKTGEAIAPHLRPGTLVVLESTTYPGTTDELLRPRLEQGGLKAGRDLFLAFSPERENPGDATWSTSRIPKVVGADDDGSRAAAMALYEGAVSKVVPVSSSRVAEATKLLENIYRCVNIALVNELKQCFSRMGIDIFEVIEAAKTKPFGFQAFYPGPGLGGHCLAGGEIVWVRDAEGVHALPFRTLFDRAARDGGVEARPDGVEVVRPQGLDALSFDLEAREPVFAPITELFRRRSPQPLLRLGIAGNRSLTVTGGHPMLVHTGFQVTETRADELEVGDALVLVTSWPDADRPWDDRIDLIEVARSHGVSAVRVMPRSGTWREHDATIRPTLVRQKLSPKDVYRHNTLPLEAALELEANGLCPFTRDELLLATGKGRSWTTVSAVLRLSEDFARLVGYYLSEGCLTTDGGSLRVRFCFGAHEQELIGDTCSVLDRLGVKHSVHRLTTCATVHIKVSSRLFGVLLRDVLRCGVRSEDASAPARLLEAPAPIRAALLAGMLRGDGDVEAHVGHRSYRKNGRSYHHRWNSAKVGFFTSSPLLFQQAIGLMQGLGLVPTFKKDRPYMQVAGPQVDALEPLLVGAKARRLETYRLGRTRAIAPRSYEPHGAFADVAVTSIEAVAPDEVFSMEVEGTHTFVTSYGLAVHNCIPLDPVYLSWKAKEFGVRTRFIDLAGEVNTAMPEWVVERTMDALNEHGKPLKGSRVLLLGMAYKKNVDDVRESPALVLWDMLKKKGAQLEFHDPHIAYVGSGRHYAIEQASQPLDAATLGRADVVLIVTDHDAVDYKTVVEHAKLVVDTRNATRDLRAGAPHVFQA